MLAASPRTSLCPSRFDVIIGHLSQELQIKVCLLDQEVMENQSNGHFLYKLTKFSNEIDS